jgi:hypothetical protein
VVHGKGSLKNPLSGRGEWDFIFSILNNLIINSENEEETDELAEIIMVDEEFEKNNGLLGLKRDIILTLIVPMNIEDDFKNIFDISHEMSLIILLYY